MKTQFLKAFPFVLSCFLSHALPLSLPLGWRNAWLSNEYQHDDFTCPSNEGLYANPEDCSTFYQCSNGSPYIQTCPSGLYFSQQIEACDYPSSVNCTVISTTASPITQPTITITEDTSVVTSEDPSTNEPDGTTETITESSVASTSESITFSETSAENSTESEKESITTETSVAQNV